MRVYPTLLTTLGTLLVLPFLGLGFGKLVERHSSCRFTFKTSSETSCLFMGLEVGPSVVAVNMLSILGLIAVPFILIAMLVVIVNWAMDVASRADKTH